MRARPVTTLEPQDTAPLSEVTHVEEAQQRIALLDGIQRGERAYEQGRSVSQAVAEARMTRWLK